MVRASVMGQTMGSGSSGVGFGFRSVEIREILTAENICLASDVQTSEDFQLGLNKRGSLVWPQVGDRWLIDRSLGHWALRCKITETSAPAVTGSRAGMDRDLLGLLGLLAGLGLVQDSTTPGATPVVTGSRNAMSPAVGSVVTALAARGLIVDQTTAATVPIGVWQIPTALLNGWTVGPDPASNFGDYAPVAYQVDSRDFLVLSGVMFGGTTTAGTNLFSLPPAYRPLHSRIVTITRLDTQTPAVIKIASNGQINLYNFGTAPGTNAAHLDLSCSIPRT